MSKDLDYFKESNLNEGNLAGFRNRLPTQELKDKFEQSLGVHGKFSPRGVLQGYRGPHPNESSGDSGYLGPSDGLQEVRYWWGATKTLHYLPISGTLAWGLLRLVEDTNWHSIFFDSKTGECLSHNREIAAAKLNTTGETLLQSGKFNEAKEYFNNAYTHSTETTLKNLYKDNEIKAQAEIDAINSNSEGDKLFRKGKYVEAKTEYQAAYANSILREQVKICRSNIDKAEAEIDAINSNSEGEKLFNQGKFAEAKARYETAYGKSNVNEKLKIYETNRENAQAELDAINLNNEGDNLFRKGKYVEAKAKYQDAYGKSNISKQYEIYKSNSDKAQAKIDALNLSSGGKQLFNPGKYAKAEAKYEGACSRSNISKHQLYKSNMDRAQVEIVSLNLCSEVDKLFKQSKYVEGYTKYQAGNNESNVSEQCEQHNSNRERAVNAEVYALHLSSKGNGLYQQGKYAEAIANYQAAYDTSQFSEQRKIYKCNIDKAKAKIDELNLKSEGDQLSHGGKCAEGYQALCEAGHKLEKLSEYLHQEY